MRNDFIYTFAIVIVLTAAGLVGAYVGGGIGLAVFAVIAGITLFGIARLAAPRPAKQDSGQTGE